MQPQQGGYPPQGYAPPQQYAPAGYGQPAPQYGPPPQGYAPQAQYVPPAPPQQSYAGPTGDEFGTPDAIGGTRARLADAGPGRLVLITPYKIERNVPNRRAKPDANGQLPTQDRMTCDVVFLDGPPFMYGGDPTGENGPPKPHTETATIPHESRGIFISNVLLVSQCERSLPVGNTPARPVLGRLVKGVPSQPGLRPPWKLEDPTDADRQVARDYLRWVQEQRISAPAPTTPPAQYAPTGYPQGGGMQPTNPPAPYGQYPPQGAPAPQQAAAQYIGDPNAGAQYAPQGYPQGAPAPQAPPAAPAVDLSVPPPGWAPEVWATVPDDQRQMIVAANAARPGI